MPIFNTKRMYSISKKLRNHLCLLACLAAGATFAYAQGTRTQTKVPPMIKVSELSTIEANQRFQKNVQIMKAKRQKAVVLNKNLEEKQGTEREAIQQELDKLMAELSTDNETMAKAYGFSLNRNYTMVVERAHVYMYVTDEEAAKIQAAQANSN